MAMLGVFGSLGPALVAMALASAGNLLIEVISMTIFQRIVPDPIRGRALGGMATITTLAYATGSLLMPVWSGAFGIGPVFVASGLLVVVGAILAIVLIGRGGDRAPAAVFVSTAARVAALPIFAGIPESRLATAFARAQELETVAGGEVIRQGDPADRFFVILEGSFDVDQVGPDGRARAAPDDGGR